MNFIRTTEVFVVKDKEDHLLKHLTKYFLVFGAMVDQEEFIMFINREKLSREPNDADIMLIKEENSTIVRDSYDYISDDPITDSFVLQTIDNKICPNILDLEKTNNIFYKPLF